MLASTESRQLAKVIKNAQIHNMDFEHRDLARELHRWVGIFDREWKLELPSYPVLHFEPIRNAYATYAWFHGSIGTPDNITMNTALLDRPSAYIIRTLGHELLHLWQQYHGKPTSQRNHHNDEYVAKAKECGILIDATGCTSGHTEAFAALIEKHGIDLPEFKPVEPGIVLPPTGGIEPKVYGTRGKNGGGSKMKKWTCGCTNIRAAVQVTAMCLSCGNPFQEAD